MGGQRMSGGVGPTIRAAVIGAGVSGVTAAKCLLDEGIEPVVLERSREIGGVWKLLRPGAAGSGLAYGSLRTNTSKQTTAFSDFPFAEQLPDFPTREDVTRYLNAYADHFDVRRRIRWGATVESVAPDGERGWRVRARMDDGAELDERFDAVLVCSGVFRRPVLPAYPGAESFRGAIMHSSAYDGPASFAGKRVAVVGLGSSGADIAVEASHAAGEVLLCTSKGAWFIPRYLHGRPQDHRRSRLAALIPQRVGLRLLRRAVRAEYRRLGIQDWPRERLLPEPPFDPARARFTPNNGLLDGVAEGRITPKPDIARLDGADVVFADGTRTAVDIVVCATGYSVEFPFIDEAIIRPGPEGLDLYRQVVHPDCPGLAFIGMFRVSGPALPVAEMQARWVARALRGRVTLPTPAAMRAAIAARRAAVARTGANPYKLDFVPYLDEIAADLGILPRWWRHPRLLWPLLAGPPTPAQYRLDGPGRWRGAAAAIRAAQTPRGPGG